MRSTLVLAQLALLTSSAHAFYPFRPKWITEAEEKRSLESRDGHVGGNGKDVTFAIKQGGREVNLSFCPSPRSRLRHANIASQSSSPAHEKAAREAMRLSRKYGRRVANDPNESSVVKRENNYDIMEAEETGDHLTAGVDQDGTDNSYFVEVQFGSKGKELHMLIDTGASATWVMGSNCDTEACSKHESFGADDSDTFEQSDKSFSVSYGSGHVKGKLASDTVSLAGMGFTYQFGVADQTSDDFSYFAFDGILGLAMNNGATENFLQAMDDADEVDANVFGISLHRAADGSNDGEIKFGSPNEARYKGDITYTSTGSKGDDWAIPLDDAAYDGKSAGVGGVLAHIDTGTTYIFGSKELVKSFHSVIPGASSSDGTTYKVPCDSQAPLTFTFSGVDFEVSSKDWISPPHDDGSCTSNIYGEEVVKGSWLLGSAFLKNVYTIFDKDKKRIGK